MSRVGEAIPERSFIINRALLKAYADASGDQNPIHQSEDFAKSVGLPDVICHGMLTMALAGKFLTDFVGGSRNVSSFSSRFVKPVVVPAGTDVALFISGVVTSELGDGRYQIDLTAMCNGVKVLGMTKAIASLNS